MSGNTGIVAPGGSGTFDERVTPDDWFAQQGAPGGGGFNPIGSPEDPQNRAYLWNHPELWTQPWTGPRPDGGTGPIAAGDRQAQMGGAPAPGGPWDEATFTQQFGTPRTPQELEALEARLNAAGIKVARNAAGVAGKIILPNGQYVDVINAAGVGGRGFQWLTGDGGAGAAGGGIGAGLENTPGYQFRLNQGLQALERSAAARGTLLTGGTMKGLQRYAQDVASTEYGNRVNQLMGLSNLGMGAAGTQAQLGSNYAGQAGALLGNQATNMTNLVTDRGNAQAAGTLGGANAINQGIGGATNLAQMYYLSRLFGGG